MFAGIRAATATPKIARKRPRGISESPVVAGLSLLGRFDLVWCNQRAPCPISGGNWVEFGEDSASCSLNVLHKPARFFQKRLPCLSEAKRHAFLPRDTNKYKCSAGIPLVLEGARRLAQHKGRAVWTPCRRSVLDPATSLRSALDDARWGLAEFRAQLFLDVTKSATRPISIAEGKPGRENALVPLNESLTSATRRPTRHRRQRTCGNYPQRRRFRRSLGCPQRLRS